MLTPTTRPRPQAFSDDAQSGQIEACNLLMLIQQIFAEQRDHPFGAKPDRHIVQDDLRPDIAEAGSAGRFGNVRHPGKVLGSRPGPGCWW